MKFGVETRGSEGRTKLAQHLSKPESLRTSNCHRQPAAPFEALTLCGGVEGRLHEATACSAGTMYRPTE